MSPAPCGARRPTAHGSTACTPAPEDLRDACAAGDLVCARQDGRPVGALVLNGRWEDYYEGKPWRVDAPGERVGVIHLVASAPDLRGRGIARALVRAAKAEARRRGLAALRLDVFDNNAPARALYASEGFVYLGTYPCRYPEGFTHDTGFMELDLGAADGAARA